MDNKAKDPIISPLEDIEERLKSIIPKPGETAEQVMMRYGATLIGGLTMEQRKERVEFFLTIIFDHAKYDIMDVSNFDEMDFVLCEAIIALPQLSHPDILPEAECKKLFVAAERFERQALERGIIKLKDPAITTQIIKIREEMKVLLKKEFFGEGFSTDERERFDELTEMLWQVDNMGKN